MESVQDQTNEFLCFNALPPTSPSRKNYPVSLHRPTDNISPTSPHYPHPPHSPTTATPQPSPYPTPSTIQPHLLPLAIPIPTTLSYPTLTFAPHPYPTNQQNPHNTPSQPTPCLTQHPTHPDSQPHTTYSPTSHITAPNPPPHPIHNYEKLCLPPHKALVHPPPPHIHTHTQTPIFVNSTLVFKLWSTRHFLKK